MTPKQRDEIQKYAVARELVVEFEPNGDAVLRRFAHAPSDDHKCIITRTVGGWIVYSANRTTEGCGFGTSIAKAVKDACVSLGKRAEQDAMAALAKRKEA